MFSLQTNVGCACVRKKSVTYESNGSYKQRLVIVMTLHIECNFNLRACLNGNTMFYEIFVCFYVSEAELLCFSLCSQMFDGVERC